MEEIKWGICNTRRSYVRTIETTEDFAAIITSSSEEAHDWVFSGRSTRSNPSSPHGSLPELEITLTPHRSITS